MQMAYTHPMSVQPRPPRPITERQRAARIISVRAVIEAAARKREQRRQEYARAPRRCRRCGDPIQWRHRENVFCGHSCAASTTNAARTRSQESRNKTRVTLKGRRCDGRPVIPRETRRCKMCGEPFESKVSVSKRYCSQPCRNRAPERRRAGGGERLKSSWSKKGHYKGIFCGSTWELAYLAHCLDNGADIQRCRRSFYYDGQHRYTPDFVVNGKFVEIKGYVADEDLLLAKLNAVRDAGEQIELVRRSEMEPHLRYARSVFGAALESAYDVT